MMDLVRQPPLLLILGVEVGVGVVAAAEVPVLVPMPLLSFDNSGGLVPLGGVPFEDLMAGLEPGALLAQFLIAV